VAFCSRKDVEKGIELFIFCNPERRDFAGNDFAEYGHDLKVGK
jgi:hypothetical protein